MKLIVGLGNPGARYEKTRHNIGFRVVDEFARRFRIAVDRHERDAMIGRGSVGGNAVIVAKPMTYMNLSGESVVKLARNYLDATDDLIVAYDEIDLPLGKIRIRENGSAGTHNGMKSIVALLGTEKFPRLRFGIRGESYAPKSDLADYVLDDFEPNEEEIVAPALERARDALVLFARDDLRRAMNEFNRENSSSS